MRWPVTGWRKPRPETRGRKAPSATMFCRPESRAGSTYRILAAPALANDVAFAPVATGIPGQPDFTTWPAPTSAAVKAFYRVDEE